MAILKVRVTSDKKHEQEIRRALVENDGYCPCSLFKSKDTKCMCQEFRNQTEPGFCHCGLYEKILK